MSNTEKTRKKLLSEISRLENQMRESLQKKTHNSAEINLGQITMKLQNLRSQLASLK